MKAKSRIYNSMFIDGSAGTGKTQVVLRYIREMRKLQHPEIEALAVSQYQNRTDALQQHLKISSEDTYTKAKLMELLLGRTLTNDDFESNKDTAHVRVLKQSVIDELSKRADI
ncbi:MAG: AAA family ATPase [Bacilli bacterium]|nr:AAA family ATPase [Bacilli bacterium]